MRVVALLVLLTGTLFAQTAEDIGTDITVQLDSGDVLVGTLTEVTDDYIVIEHWLFKSVQISRSRIVSPDEAAAGDDAVQVAEPSVEEPESPWTGKIDFSINGSRGNNQKVDYRANLNVRRETEEVVDAYDLLWTASLNEVRSDVLVPDGPDPGTEPDEVERKTTEKTADRIYASARREWFVDGTKWRPFGQAAIEMDDFKDFDQRVTLIAGAAYPLISEKKQKWDARVGAGGSREFGGEDESWTPEALLATNYLVEFMPLHTFTFGLELYPNLEDQGEYRSITRAQWDIAPADASPWRFNFGVEHFYDSDSEQGTSATDLNYFVGAGRSF